MKRENLRLNDYARDCHTIARKHGFWPSGAPRELFDDVNLMLSKLMLVTTEVAEAAEAVRHNDRGNLVEELADICIRVFDLSAALNVDIEQEIADKMTLNEQRRHMHGKRA